MKQIPVCEPYLNGNEKRYVMDCLKTNWISSNGKYIEMFEKKFAKFCNVKYGVSCSNGTAALHLAVASLGIGKDDEVIVPAFTMIAVPNSVLYTGAKPVFVDADFHTWNMDENKIEEKITKKTKAIIAVHTYGFPADMDKIKKIAKKHNLYIIEDCAEAHGALYKGKKVGSFGDIACFSFYANKIITTGEGGMVVTNNKKLADKAKSLRNHAFGEPRFYHKEMGFNYRMTNIQAAIGLAQLEKINQYISARIKNAKLYNHYLKDVEGINLPPENKDRKNVYWMYGIVIANWKMNIIEFTKKLKAKGIDTRSFFYPCNEQPYIKSRTHCPNANSLWLKGLYLPSASNLKKEEIKYVYKSIKEILK